MNDYLTVYLNGEHSVSVIMDQIMEYVEEALDGYGDADLMDKLDDLTHRVNSLREDVAAPVRRGHLRSLVDQYGIAPGVDYDFEDLFEVVNGTGPVGRYAAVMGDETYHDIIVCRTLDQALSAMSARTGGDTLGLPIAVHDLDDGRELRIAVTVSLQGPPSPRS